MKTPEKIKKGLAACSADECHGQHEGCTYQDQFFCTMRMCGDALAYIQQLESLLGLQEAATRTAEQRVAELESRLAQAERERDAAVAELSDRCLYCKNVACKLEEPPCADCMQPKNGILFAPRVRTHFEWRGPCPENTKEADGDGNAESTPDP